MIYRIRNGNQKHNIVECTATILNQKLNNILGCTVMCLVIDSSLLICFILSLYE